MHIIIASIVFSYYFVHIAGIPKAIKKGFKMEFHKRIKPFDCVPCLSVWISALLFFLPTIITTFILITFSTGCLAVLVYYILEYLKYKSKIF